MDRRRRPTGHDVIASLRTLQSTCVPHKLPNFVSLWILQRLSDRTRFALAWFTEHSYNGLTSKFIQ